jgi:hypothetical protein
VSRQIWRGDRRGLEGEVEVDVSMGRVKEVVSNVRIARIWREVC